MRSKSFYKNKFRSMLLTGTFTMAVTYIMLLSDSIIAGHFLGEDGVSAINLLAPVNSVMVFLSCIISLGTGIQYSRSIGRADTEKASKLYGQGMIVSVAIAVLGAVVTFFMRDVYFSSTGASESVTKLAGTYYTLLPLNSALTVVATYVSNMVYTDGDEAVNNLSYIFQIGGNIVLSVVLCAKFGMIGIIIGTVTGNVLALIVLIRHFFKESNTLHFTWYFNLKDLVAVIKFSILDSCVYLCWGVVDFIVIGHISRNYGEDALVILAVVVSLIEFSVVLDGVGMAIEPLVGTYLGEKNHTMIKRLMKTALSAAVTEGLVASGLIFIFTRQFIGLFGVTDGAIIPDAVIAVRLVCAALVVCAVVSLTSSYYLLVDHVGLALCLAVIKDGLLYSLLPVFCSELFGEVGIWIGFALAPVAALALFVLFDYLRYRKKNFPWIIENTDDRIEVVEDILSLDTVGGLSRQTAEIMKKRGFSEREMTWASLFVEETALTIFEKNKDQKAVLNIEFSLIFDEGSVLIIERDSGKIFDLTDPEMAIDGLSSFIIEGILESHKEKVYQTTTGYNRNMIRLRKA